MLFIMTNTTCSLSLSLCVSVTVQSQCYEAHVLLNTLTRISIALACGTGCVDFKPGVSWSPSIRSAHIHRGHPRMQLLETNAVYMPASLQCLSLVIPFSAQDCSRHLLVGPKAFAQSKPARQRTTKSPAVMVLGPIKGKP